MALDRVASDVGASMNSTDRAVCVCFDGDRFVLMRRFNNGRHYCVLPGGGVEPGERPADAAVRELREETGLIGVVLQRLGSIEHEHRRAHYFLLRVSPDPLLLVGPEIISQTADSQHSPAWVLVSQIDNEPIVPIEARAVVHEAYRLLCEGARSRRGAPSGSGGALGWGGSLVGLQLIGPAEAPLTRLPSLTPSCRTE